MVAYDRQTYNAPNPMARLAHRARYGNADRLIAKYLKPDGVMLDYGCGDGRMLRRVRELAPAADLIGYEPLMQGEGEGYRRFTREEDARGCRYDLVTAFEVLEHLLPEDIDKFVALTKDTIKADGRVIISVPIMLGPVLIPKVINAQFIRKSAWKYSFSELVRGAIFLKPVPRYHGSQYLSHKGFDWRELRTQLMQEFKLQEECFSPFPALPWGLNSQWFGVFSPR